METLSNALPKVGAAYAGEAERCGDNIAAGNAANITGFVYRLYYIGNSGFDADAEGIRRPGEALARYLVGFVHQSDLRFCAAAVHAKIYLVGFALPVTFSSTLCHRFEKNLSKFRFYS